MPDSIEWDAGADRADVCPTSDAELRFRLERRLPVTAGGGRVAARRALTVVLALYGTYLLRHAGEGSLLDSVDLAIHETGHIVFGPFGELIGFAGGTLMQLLMPLVFVVYFVRRKDQHAASVALWWVGQSCANVSVYAADARAESLPLVGGGEHDWAYLLASFGWLEHDQCIGRTFLALAALAMLGATVWGLVSASAAPVSELSELDA
ncbi:MAG: hypothetical protein ABI601_14415 [bacterium]